MSLLPDPTVQAQNDARNASYQAMHDHSKFLETLPIDPEINSRADEILSELNVYSLMKVHYSAIADNLSAEIYNKYNTDPLVVSSLNSKFCAGIVPGWQYNSDPISRFHGHISYYRNLVYTYRQGLRQETHQKMLEEERRKKMVGM